MTTALVIHGHFYQPPRENPWTNIIDRQPSASPFPNWNERIHRECYRPNAFARVIDNYGRVEHIVNNYANISFNFGPTLFGWLAQYHPTTYARIIEADRASVRRHAGHGNAIAQGYHHAILPLCNERDRRTEINWGLADFRHRFGRAAESLWLPETAANDGTLAALIDAGLTYVILSPHQAERVRRVGTAEWQNVADGSVDPSVPYRYLHPDGSGRSLAVFFYDGHVAKAIAFDGALASSRTLLDRFERAANSHSLIVNVATDGESYGHHFKFGDRGLAYALEVEAAGRGFAVTNYGAFLAQHEPEWECEIKRGPDGEGTAWSCAHGVGRWARDCSCHAGAQEGWNQKWRAPLRAALNFLRDEAARHFESLGRDLLEDPWAARDEYVEVLLGGDRAAFLARHAGRQLSAAEQVRALTLLELQRSALLMFTSCGWFFNDISGIETVQDLKYAGRLLDFMWELGLKPPLAEFLEQLAEAQSNVPEQGNGADVYRRSVESARVTPRHVAASLAISSLVNRAEEAGTTAGYEFACADFELQRHGRLTLATGRFELTVAATGRRHTFAAAAMHFGGIDFYCVLRAATTVADFAAAAARLWAHFRTASLPFMLRAMQEEFGPEDYGLEHLLPEGRQRIYEIVFGHMVGRFAEEYERLYEDNRRNIEMLQEAGFELPRELRAAAEFTIARRFESELQKLDEQSDPAAYVSALRIAHEVTRLGYRIDRMGLGQRLEVMLTSAVRRAVEQPVAAHYEAAQALITLAQRLNLEANFERAQECVFEALRRDQPIPAALKELAVHLRLAPELLRTAEPGHEARAAAHAPAPVKPEIKG